MHGATTFEVVISGKVYTPWQPWRCSNGSSNVGANGRVPKVCFSVGHRTSPSPATLNIAGLADDRFAYRGSAFLAIGLRIVFDMRYRRTTLFEDI